MKITTSRFGAIEVDFSKVIEMKGPILGFERLRKFALIEHNKQSPFLWLQSVEDGAVAFVVVDPFMVKADYAPTLGDEDVRLLEIGRPTDVLVLAIVTIRKEPFAATANLRAPVIVHATRRIAKQIVLEDDVYPVQYPLADRPADRPSHAGARAPQSFQWCEGSPEAAATGK